MSSALRLSGAKLFRQPQCAIHSKNGTLTSKYGFTASVYGLKTPKYDVPFRTIMSGIDHNKLFEEAKKKYGEAVQPTIFMKILSKEIPAKV